MSGRRGAATATAATKPSLVEARLDDCKQKIDKQAANSRGFAAAGRGKARAVYPGTSHPRLAAVCRIPLGLAGVALEFSSYRRSCS